MKQLSLAAFILCLLAACNSETTSTENTKDTVTTTTAENVTYAYTPTYSADFEIGDPKNARIVLELWKDYDNNALDNHKDAFADSLEFDLSSGANIKGTRDSVLNSMKAYRSGFSSATSSVDVVISLRPKGKDESWVCVWGKEIDVKDNKADSVYLNENWMFNKDGKIVYMNQYMANPPAKK